MIHVHVSWGAMRRCWLGGDIAGVLTGGGKVLIGRLDYRSGSEGEATVRIEESGWDKAAHCPLF